MVTGLDLVELQLRVAAGEPLPFSQHDLEPQGHAIEARIYAEDPQRDFLPATGRLVHVAFPAETADVRMDAGVASGDEITPWFDPMIGKLIVRGLDRRTALARMAEALGQTEIVGVKTNVQFLRRLVACRDFQDANLDTGLIARNPELVAPAGSAPIELLAAAAYAELAYEERAAGEVAARSGDPYSPWYSVDGWRLNEDSHHDFVFLDGESEHRVRVRFAEHGLRFAFDNAEHGFAGETLPDGQVSIRLDDRVFKARAVRTGDDWHIFAAGEQRTLTLKEARPREEGGGRAGSLAAPMPGRIVQVLSRAGQAVKKGQALLILEAMKMEHTITAPADGVVKEIHFAAGEQVLEGVELVSLE
jgi:3-methylcrotonyl-CoA carboxylase alpha subunit